MMLDADGSRALAGILHDYARVTRELIAAKTLLLYCQQNKVYPFDYQRELDEAKKNPDYPKIAQKIDIVADRLEQFAQKIDVSELLKTIPPESPTN